MKLTLWSASTANSSKLRPTLFSPSLTPSPSSSRSLSSLPHPATPFTVIPPFQLSQEISTSDESAIAKREESAPRASSLRECRSKMVTMLDQELIFGVRRRRAMLWHTWSGCRSLRRGRKLGCGQTHASLSSRSPGTAISSRSVRVLPLLSSSRLIGVVWEVGKVPSQLLRRVAREEERRDRAPSATARDSARAGRPGRDGLP